MNDRMPQFPESYWTEVDSPPFPKLAENAEADIVIVGAGITGITAGLLLVQEGFKVIILEAGKVMNGTTGYTTAKITAQHGLIYDELISHFGVEKARSYYEASKEAQNFIEKIVIEKKIDCDLSKEDAYIYAVSKENQQKLEKEMLAYEKLGIQGHLTDSIPVPIETQSVLVMKEQAQFHPLKYLSKLVQSFISLGGTIYEHTTVAEAEEGDKPKAITVEGYRVKGKYIISASHFPFTDLKGLYFARLLPERSYVLGIQTDSDFPGGMYYSADKPVRSIRSTPFNGEKLILVGGEGHKTGQGINTLKHYMALEKFAEDTFGIKVFPYRWSAQDLVTLDKVPYIGPITAKHPNLLVATGYRKWGMTNGTAAALLLRDIILGKENRFAELFTPSRFVADPSIKKLISFNADTAGHLIKGKLEYVPKTMKDLNADEGAPVIVNGKRAGAYKDKEGVLHVVDTTCTHMGCETEWNEAERSWDCPCHGSRFSYTGKVLEGPAEKPLKKIK